MLFFVLLLPLINAIGYFYKKYNISLFLSVIPLCFGFYCSFSDDQFIDGTRYFKLYFNIFESMDFIFLMSNIIYILVEYKISRGDYYKKNLYLFLISLSKFCSGVCFYTVNLFIFYIAFELVLIPMYFIIKIWGDKERDIAAKKFLIFTISCSILALFALVKIANYYTQLGGISLASFDRGAIVENLYHLTKNDFVLFIILSISFLVKVPAVGLHVWLPTTHVQAPTYGSMILASVLLKIGFVGILNFSSLFFEQEKVLKEYFLILSICSIIYPAIICFYLSDIKKIIAYSSISHMGYVLLVYFSGYEKCNISREIALFQVVSHGLISAGLFFIVGHIYKITKTRELSDFGGLAKKIPILSNFFLFFSLASIGAPLTSGFIGEFFSIYCASSNNIYYGIIACIGPLLSAIYMIRVFKNSMWGEFFTNNQNLQAKNDKVFYDLSREDVIILSILALSIVFLGVCPSVLLNHR